jgi:hypothetical protein
VQPEIATFQLPLTGEWRVLRTPGHHRFAFDFAAIGGERGTCFAGRRRPPVFGHLSAEEAYGWSKPVFAPAEGDVVAATDDWPDTTRLNLVEGMLRVSWLRPKPTTADLRPVLGNYVVIQTGWVYALLAHLKQGSLLVRPGQHVHAHQPIGLVGNSGSSVTPHLHFEAKDSPQVLGARTVAIRFREFEVWDGRGWRGVAYAAPEKGRRIRLSGQARRPSGTAVARRR